MLPSTVGQDDAPTLVVADVDAAGQLEAVKAQLTRQREQNGALEAAVRRRDADADRLRKMVAKEGIGGGHEAKQGGT